MKDFIRIGGEITSAPLNENFRRLRNDITISNTNLVFSKEYGIQMTIKDMQDLITNPEVNLENGQACYVVSSGELYRFATYDMQWHKIADFGQTFRQGFLNSGVVAIQQVSDTQKAFITRKNNTTLTIPAMLVYFKTLMGDERYLKGMYLVEEQDLDVSEVVNTPGAYSIFLDGHLIDEDHGNQNKYFVASGMPSQDDPNAIYIGGFMIDNSRHVVGDFIYTIPDVAYTADRGLFYLNGGQVTGGYLQPTSVDANLVMGISGLYYDEGINAPQADLDDFPIDSFSSSNYNIRTIGAEGSTEGLSKLIYMYPDNPLSNIWTDTRGALVYDKVYDEATGTLKTIEPGQFTIQRHLITPCGFDCTDVILYGKRVYNSMADALSNINRPEVLDLEFPYVEVTRLIVGYPLSGEFIANDPEWCSFNTLERISQIGTFEPEFADNKFIIYSGDLTDPNPSKIGFSLDDLQTEDYNELYKLYISGHNAIREKFAISSKYITDGIIPSIATTLPESRTITRNGITIPGYEIADVKDLNDIRTRLGDIEKELWSIYNSDNPLYEQSVRYRLFHLEDRTSNLETRITTAESNISNLSKVKVNKNTTINGYKLGDDLTDENEVKTFSLVTGDIVEGTGLGSRTNLWYTDARVNANPNVSAAYTHSNKHGSGIVSDTNPHGLSLDNVTDGINSHSVSTVEKNKIENLPNNTVSEITQLQNNKIESILIKQVDGSSTTTTGTETSLGRVKTLRFFDSGTNVTIAGDMATIECVGQTSRDTVMFKSDYATLSSLDPVTYAGTVDKAAEAFVATNISGIAAAGNNKYYGTNNTGLAGIYDLPAYVSSADASSYATIDDVTFQPIDKSVRLAHLGDSTVTYGPTDEETTLGTNLHDLIVNHYHTALDSATLKSNEINEWNFGNNLTVTINGHRATINATGSGGSGGVTSFANLDDVNVTYTGNAGKLVIVNEEENGLVLSAAPSFSNYMLKSTYVSTTDPRKVNLAVLSDRALNADSATTALTLQSAYSVNDGGLADTDLWSAERIMEYTNTTTPDTYSGTTVPSASLGKDGDIYILIES